VISYRGKPLKKLRRAWKTLARIADDSSGDLDSPHIMRHTAATWMMRSNVPVLQISSYLGMSPETLMKHYAHHHPDFQSEASQFSGKAPALKNRKTG
jgi:integrase